jgi:peptidoglycan/xylan/chitin deacetylase (PgdA/CDA1 family)
MGERSFFEFYWPVNLLYYHGIPACDDDFVDGSSLEQQIIFLKKHFLTVGFDGLIAQISKSGKPRIALTFDDGYQNNAAVAAPILRRHGVPATFFVCNRHTQRGKYLWFSYLRALEKHFKGNGFKYQAEFIDMSKERRKESLKRLRAHLLSLNPHPSAMYLEIENYLPAIEDFVDDHDLQMRYAGMSEEQIGELANDDLFSVQAHTADHPFLTRCSREEALRQLGINKTWLEGIIGKDCSAVAYPSGDYDDVTVDLCRSLGFKRGFAVIPKELSSPPYEIPRVGVFSKSLGVFAVKAKFGRIIRKLGVPVG